MTAAMDWGTVPTWVSAILTGGSLLLGFYILLRDRRKEETAEARKLVFAVHQDETGARMRVTNVSDRPFLEIQPFNWSRTQWQVVAGASTSTVGGPLLPGDSITFSYAGRTPVMGARFQDADGQYWFRTFGDDDHRLIRAPKNFRYAYGAQRILIARQMRKQEKLPGISLTESYYHWRVSRLMRREEADRQQRQRVEHRRNQET
ncbi:hypothetical protein [Streptomyces albogriseolus]|uniref:hypothetical protein n=1 Tax=Streptomyces albogriseolus TaxID=1887 RepID=UPI003CF61061